MTNPCDWADESHTLEKKESGTTRCMQVGKCFLKQAAAVFARGTFIRVSPAVRAVVVYFVRSLGL